MPYDLTDMLFVLFIVADADKKHITAIILQ